MKNSFFKQTSEFGFKFALSYSLDSLFIKLFKSKKFKSKRHNLIVNYINKNYGHLLVDSTKTEAISSSCKVFVFWWQGIDKNTPELVRACINSVKQNFASNEVVILTKQNLSNYLTLPNYILEKVESGEITLTHFSDIIRVSLLYEYGGIWLDATIYQTKPIINEVSKYSFYSNKLAEESVKNNSYISNGEWSGFFMAGTKGDELFLNLKNIFLEYWKTHHTLIAYLFLDYCIKLMQIKLPNIKNKIASVPVNNNNIYQLVNSLFKKESEVDLKEILNSSSIFKLSYKFPETKTSEEGTVYKKLIENLH